MSGLKVIQPDNRWTLNDEIEKRFLGCLLQEPFRIDDVIDLINEVDFSVSRWGILYRLMKQVHARDGMFDFDSLAKEVDAFKPKNDITFGASDTYLWLLKLTPEGTYPENILKYAGKIRAHAIRLRLVRAASTIFEAATDNQRPLDDVVDLALKEVDQAAELAPALRTNFVRLMDAYLEQLEVKMQRGPASMLTPTGMRNIDSAIGGLARGEVTVLAGHAKGGKTTMALNIAQNVVEAGGAVHYFSIEMTAAEMMNRVFARLTGIDKAQLRSGGLDGDAYSRLVALAGKLTDWKLYLLDRGALMNQADARVTPMRIRRALRHLREKPDLVVIDGLWLLDADQPVERGRRDLEIRQITMDLVRLAADLDVPVLLLHQYNREAIGMTRPSVDHLAEGSSVERNVQVIWAMKRAQIDDGSDVTTIYVLGDRNGGSTNMEFHFSYDPVRTLYQPAQIKRVDLADL
jgi:replicative DNA helicase